MILFTQEPCLDPVNPFYESSEFTEEEEEIQVPVKPSCYPQSEPISVPSFEFKYNDIDPLLARMSVSQAPSKVKKILCALTTCNLEGFEPQNIILFEGPSGSGKSTLARAIGHELSIPITLVHGSLLSNEYKNSGAQNLMRIIRPIVDADAGHLIVIEEINSIMEQSKENKSTDNDIAMALWSILDEVAQSRHVLFIGTTNDISKMPEQLKSRFGSAIIHIPHMQREQRLKIICHYLPKNKKNAKFVPYLLKITKNRSIRDIKKVIMEAIANAWYRLVQDMQMVPDDFNLENKKIFKFMDLNYNENWRKFSDFSTIKTKKRKLILHYLPPNHNLSEEFIDELLDELEDIPDFAMRTFILFAISHAVHREKGKLELTWADFNDTDIKNWHGWYHPSEFGKKIKKYIFSKESFPVVLQLIGLSIQALGLYINCHYSAFNKNNAEENMKMAIQNKINQEESMFIQKAGAALQYVNTINNLELSGVQTPLKKSDGFMSFTELNQYYDKVCRE